MSMAREAGRFNQAFAFVRSKGDLDLEDSIQGGGEEQNEMTAELRSNYLRKSEQY